ncbi:hypothetical protein CJ179_38725 [Rhodococcus sp. ACS1]|uniref:hypothetical protein n=1 Tax=Rhodococcus sp. ACS1 TaxID=2028570 RepID=UPI000BB149B4|nr:hypothetical protein [Rhodococcus sp. ACS1]PBC38536.1 hypothetical protein CJ179_38725 [Rhodococcus sp. ACS1]
MSKRQLTISKLQPGLPVNVGKGWMVWQVDAWNLATGVVRITREDPYGVPISQNQPIAALRAAR